MQPKWKQNTKPGKYVSELIILSSHRFLNQHNLKAWWLLFWSEDPTPVVLRSYYSPRSIMSLGWPEPIHYYSSEGQSKAPAFTLPTVKNTWRIGTREKSETKSFPSEV